MMGTKILGICFDEFLEEVTASAIKRYITFQLSKKMYDYNLNNPEMTRHMDTSQSALDRLLDPRNSSLTLQTLQSATHALGGQLKVELEFRNNVA